MMIGILGASSQIGVSLARELANDFPLCLFGRDPDAARLKLAAAGCGELPCYALEQLFDHRLSVLINCLGPGDPARMRTTGPGLLRLIQQLDYLGLDYLARYPETGYVYMSTGAVYGVRYNLPLAPEACFSLPVNAMRAELVYPLAKFEVELRHRLLAPARICDLRIFGFFSEFIRLDDSFFLAQLSAHLLAGRTFVTGSAPFIRDYIGPAEIAAAVKEVLRLEIPNRAYDLISREPVTKAEILDIYCARGLRCAIEDGACLPLEKPRKMSLSDELYRDGLQQLSSRAVIERELERLQRRHR